MSSRPIHYVDIVVSSRLGASGTKEGLAIVRPSQNKSIIHGVCDSKHMIPMA